MTVDTEVTICEEYGCEDEAEVTSDDNQQLCDDHMVTCGSCRGTTNEMSTTWTRDENQVCEDCAADYESCSDCSELVHRDWLMTVGDDYYMTVRTVCEQCFEYSDYHSCDDCGVILDCDSFHHTDWGIYCPSCRSDESAGIEEWDYKPTPNLTSADDDTPDEKLYLGIELEVEDGHSAVEDLLADWSDALYFKHDGSLDNGFEAVSHPLTFKAWQETTMIDEMTKKLKAAGATSFNTTTCGMHIHMSRNAFGKAHMWKFLQFHYRNVEMIEIFAQRSSNGWAKFDSAYDKTARKQESKTGQPYQMDRYQAINLTNHYTVELRYFKGSLHPDAVKRNIQLAAALYAYTAQLSYADIRGQGMTVKGFFDYLDQHKTTYPELVAFAVDKFDRFQRAMKVQEMRTNA